MKATLIDEDWAGHILKKNRDIGSIQFKYYVIKEVGGWGQKMTILDDLQCCKSSKSWVGGPKKVKNMMTYYLNGPKAKLF